MNLGEPKNYLTNLDGRKSYQVISDWPEPVFVGHEPNRVQLAVGSHVLPSAGLAHPANPGLVSGRAVLAQVAVGDQLVVVRDHLGISIGPLSMVRLNSNISNFDA